MDLTLGMFGSIKELMKLVLSYRIHSELNHEYIQ